MPMAPIRGRSFGERGFSSADARLDVKMSDNTPAPANDGGSAARNSRRVPFRPADGCRWSLVRFALLNMGAERGGFEPPVPVSPHTAFPLQHNRPLCHLSEFSRRAAAAVGH